MTRFIGLYKELKENENVILEDGILTPTVFVREVESKKFLGSKRRELPILCLMTTVYLTDKRLIFLVLHEIEAVALRKRGVPALTGVEGSWYEIPLSAIRSVTTVRKEIKREKEFGKVLSNLTAREAVALTEISYDGGRASGGLKEYIKSIFDVEGMEKIFDVKKIVSMTDKVHMLSEQAVSLVPKLKSLCL